MFSIFFICYITRSIAVYVRRWVLAGIPQSFAEEWLGSLLACEHRLRLTILLVHNAQLLQVIILPFRLEEITLSRCRSLAFLLFSQPSLLRFFPPSSSLYLVLYC